MDSLEYLSTYPTKSEAELVQGLLESNGIKCFLQFNEVGDALGGGFGISNGPTVIYVAHGDLGKARQLIDVK